MSKKKVNSLVWFRNNLRISDNLSLSNCIKNSDRVIGYINIDPDNFDHLEYIQTLNGVELNVVEGNTDSYQALINFIVKSG